MKSLFTLLCSLVINSLLAQGYEGQPCTGGAIMLKELISKKEMAKWYANECGHNSRAIASSILAASGKAPLKVSDPNFKPPDNWDESEGDHDYDYWTCMYAGGRAMDGLLTTAWVEGNANAGSGEVLLVTGLDLSKPVEIFGGYAKSPSLYASNNRPKTINLYIIQAMPKDYAQCGTYFETIKQVASGKVVLKDMNQYQPLKVPVFTPSSYEVEGGANEYTYWLLIELVDVYAGSKYNDTCISEIRNKPEKAK